MLDFLFEFFVQVVFELVGELLLDLGFDAAAWIVRRWVPRTIALGLLGLAAGFWWGAYLNDEGRAALPRTFWVSLVIAAVAFLLALGRAASGEPDDDRLLAPPTRWPVQRCVGFAILSVMVALGVWWGFR